MRSPVGGPPSSRSKAVLVGRDPGELRGDGVRVSAHLPFPGGEDLRLQALGPAVPVEVGVEGHPVEGRRVAHVDAAVELRRQGQVVGPALLGDVARLAGHLLRLRQPLVEEELLAELDLARGQGVVGRDRGHLLVREALGKVVLLRVQHRRQERQRRDDPQYPAHRCLRSPTCEVEPPPAAYLLRAQDGGKASGPQSRPSRRSKAALTSWPWRSRRARTPSTSGALRGRPTSST